MAVPSVPCRRELKLAIENINRVFLHASVMKLSLGSEPPGLEPSSGFESTADLSGCSAGYLQAYCQLPKFSQSTFYGTVCASGKCYKWNSNNNPIAAYYIVHNKIDITTSAIPKNSNSWVEKWKSSS